MKKFIVIVWLSVVISGCTLSGTQTKVDPYAHMVRYTVASDFETVRDQAKDAITDRGMVINNISHIGNMLERTRKDLGIGERLYLHAEALEFCSAVISRKMMETDPHNIVFCPYIIIIYELPKQPGKIHVAYRKPQLVGSDASRASLKAVEKLLDDIAREAIE